MDNNKLEHLCTLLTLALVKQHDAIEMIISPPLPGTSDETAVSLLAKSKIDIMRAVNILVPDKE